MIDNIEDRTCSGYMRDVALFFAVDDIIELWIST